MAMTYRHFENHPFAVRPSPRQNVLCLNARVASQSQVVKNFLRENEEEKEKECKLRKLKVRRISKNLNKGR